jgi:putative ABC transport system permease protein
MRLPDLIRLSADAVRRSRLRSVMLLVAMAIGVAAVIVLTSLAEGAREYISGEFRSLGTHLLIILPGRSETGGVNPANMPGETPRDLTIGDADALLRIPDVRRVVKVVVGTATASSGSLERDVPVLGASADLLAVRGWRVSQGDPLPAGDSDRAVCLIGANIAHELFPGQSAIGRLIRLGERRFRVIGVLRNEGRAMEIDVQEVVVVPVKAGQALFNSESLFRVLVEARSRESLPRVEQQVIATLKARHQGEEDVTVITQDALLATFDQIFLALTLALAGIASISLAVAGVLVMNVMLVAVSQRTAEIGLLKAVGATRRQITSLFLAEAVMLSLAGAALGLMAGFGVTWLARQLFPQFALFPPAWAVVLAVLTAVASSVVFGLQPARRAARLDPVLALSGKR